MWLLFIKDCSNALHKYLGTDDSDNYKPLVNIYFVELSILRYVVIVKQFLRYQQYQYLRYQQYQYVILTVKSYMVPCRYTSAIHTAKKSTLCYFQLIVLFWWYSSKKEHLVKCMAAAWYTRGTNRNVAFFAKTVTLSGDTSDWMWINRASYKGVPQCVVFIQDEGDSVVGFCGVW